MRPVGLEIQRLQNGPILPALLRLALPNVLAMMMAVLVGIAETWYVGRLSTTPLACTKQCAMRRCCLVGQCCGDWLKQIIPVAA